MSKKTLLTKTRNKSKFSYLANKERSLKKLKPLAYEIKKIENHPFYQNLVKYSMIPLWEEAKKAKKENREPKPDKEFIYHAHVFQYASSLFEALKRLHDIPYFMEQNPNLTWMEHKNLTTQEWFIYHYANYRVVATGVLDTVLLVVNDVLEMGIAPKDVHRKDFLGKHELIESELLPPLLKLDELMEKYRQERNKYVHRSERPEIDFVDNLNAYRFLREAKEKGLYKGQLPKLTMAHAYFVEQRSIKAGQMRKETSETFAVVLEFLDNLSPIYLEKAKFSYPIFDSKI